MLSRPGTFLQCLLYYTVMYLLQRHLVNSYVLLDLRWLISLVHLFVLIMILDRFIIYTVAVSSPNVFQRLLIFKVILIHVNNDMHNNDE